MTKRNAPQTDPLRGRSRNEVLDEINRKLITFIGKHRRCRAPICRRLGRCADPGYRCKRDFPSPPLTEEQSQEARISARRALDAEIERRKARGEWTDR